MEVGQEQDGDQGGERDPGYVPRLRTAQPALDGEGDERGERQTCDRHQPLRHARVPERGKGVPERRVER